MSYLIGPKLRKLFFRCGENTGKSIENAMQFPTDAEIITSLQSAGILNISGTGSPVTNHVVPAYIGQNYIDTGGKCYYAKGLTYNDWIELTNK